MKLLSGSKLVITVLTVLLFIICTGNKTSAQKDNHNAIDLNFGASNFHIRDALSSPIIFSGTGIAPSVRFTQLRKRSIHQVEGSYYHDFLFAGAKNFSTENFRGSFRYVFYLKAIARPVFQKQFEFSLGGSVTSFFCKSDYYFDMPSVRARSLSTWYWSHSLDLAAMFDYYPSDRNLIRFQVHMPVISNVARPGYSSMDHYNLEKNDWEIRPFGETGIFPKNSSISTNLLYQQKIGNKAYLQLNWEFYFAQYKDPATIRMYMNNFRLGAGFNF